MSEFSPANNTVFGLYANGEFAEEAVQELMTAGGFPGERVTVLFPKNTQSREFASSKEPIALLEQRKARQQICLWMEPGDSPIPAPGRERAHCPTLWRRWAFLRNGAMAGSREATFWCPWNAATMKM